MITRIDADNLKDKQRKLRDGFGESLGLRVHRAISWLQRAAREDDDRDAAFVSVSYTHLTLPTILLV